MSKLLLVDDDELVRSVVRRMLEKRSWLVFEASTGQEGLRLAELRGPDLLICDVLLPDMEGGAVVASIRRFKPGLPTVIMSGLLDPAPPSVTGLPGVQILHKPFTEVDLCAAVDTALGTGGTTGRRKP